MERLARYLLVKSVTAKHLRHRLSWDEMFQISVLTLLEHGNNPGLFSALSRNLRRAVAELDGREYLPRKSFPRVKLPPGPCANHPDRPGVRIVEGIRYCHSCGVIRKRRMAKQLKAGG